MTIGVFGDSFASPTCHGGDPTTSWVYHLGSTAVSHGKASTSVLWSYIKFLEHHEKYDQNIFVITSPARADHFGDHQGGTGDFIHNLDLCFRMLKENKWASVKNWKPHRTWKNLDKIRAFRDYYIHIQNNAVDKIYTELMIRDILIRRPDTIFIPMGTIPMFSEFSTCSDYLELQTRSLFETRMENFNLFERYQEIGTSCHFTPEINQLFASHIRSALSVKSWQNWHINELGNIPHAQSWDVYYEPLVH
jgi:hypothetical protein